MSTLTDKVVAAKEALVVAVGDNWPQYIANMKLWFCNKWTKEEFDFECRKFLTPEKIHLHNQFLLAMLNKIEAFTLPPVTTTTGLQMSPTNSVRSGASSSTGSSRKRKRSSRTYYDRVPFEPYDFLDYISEDNMQVIRPPVNSEQAQAHPQNIPTQRYCVQELFLPDAGFIMGRYLIGAWEVGLVSVDDDVAEYVAMAVQVFLKNLISSIILQRRNYRTTSDGNFYYDVGAPERDPSLRNTVTRQKVDDVPLELDKELTSSNAMRRTNDDSVFLSICEDVEPTEHITISLKDCQRAFRDRNLIPSHSLYAINKLRLNLMMH